MLFFSYFTQDNNDDDQEDEEDGEEEEFDAEDDGSSVETRFLQIVQRMQLSHLETAALRLAIARSDASVREVSLKLTRKF